MERAIPAEDDVPRVNNETFTRDRVELIAETHTLTEVRNEASDPDRGTVFLETQTMTKVSGELNDADPGARAELVEWNRGELRPLLFRDAILATGEAREIRYDPILEVAVDDNGLPLILSGTAPTTTEHTAAHGEAADQPDR